MTETQVSPSSTPSSDPAWSGLRQRLLAGGLLWAALCTLPIYMPVTFYTLFGESALTPETGTALILLTLPIFLALKTRRSITDHHDQRSLLLITAAALAACWVGMAIYVHEVWGSIKSAEKILLLGFFVLMLGMASRRSLLVVSLTPIVMMHCWFIYQDAARSHFDVLISVLKFPILAGIFLSMLEQLLKAEQQHIEEKDALIRQLEHSSLTDELTQISNRKGFNRTLTAALAFAERHQTPLCLILLDIDCFKQYNDRYGHPEGDHCLQILSRVLTRCCQRRTDSVARIGGEEFALILPDSSVAQAQQTAQRVIDTLAAENIPHAGSSIADRVTISMGIAEYHGQGFDTLYTQADQALYKAKHGGRNRCHISDVAALPAAKTA